MAASAESLFDAALAISFVESRGDQAELARLRALLSGTATPDTVVDAVLDGQREDGGWAPFWAPNYSGLDATCFRLALAEQLGVRDGECVARAGLHRRAAAA